MKKLIFAGIIVSLLTLFPVACDNDEYYPEMGVIPSSFTLTLCPPGECDNLGPDEECIHIPKKTNSERALTHKEANLGYNLLEAVFVAESGTGIVIARSSWDRGAGSAIRGVYRGTAGIDYGSVDITDVALNTQGAAILFLGDSNRTLLAVGKLTGTFVNGVLQDATPADVTKIDSNTTSVEFTVVSLSAGLASTVNDLMSSDPIPVPIPFTASSFLTAVAIPDTGTPVNEFDGPDASGITSGTTINLPRTNFQNNFKINNADFPFYLFAASLTDTYYYRAKYTMYTADSTGRIDIDDPDYGLAEVFSSGIIVKGNPETEFITPNALVDDKKVPVNEPFEEYTLTQVNNLAVFANNEDTDNFDPEILFNMTVPPMKGRGITSFNFTIPVVALTVDNTTLTNLPPITWKIQSGTDQYILDNGRGGAGGAIIIGVGDASSLDISVGWQ